MRVRRSNGAGLEVDFTQKSKPNPAPFSVLESVVVAHPGHIFLESIVNTQPAGDAGTLATEPVNRGAEIARGIEFLLINCRVNPNGAQVLMAAGVKVVNQSIERTEQVVQRHAAEAAAIGRDGFRGNRTDTAGNRQADSGVPLFGWDPKGRQLVSMRTMVADLEAQGYRLVSVNLRKKDGDTMFSLFVKFQKPGEGVTVTEIGSGAQVAIDRQIHSVFEHCHGYRNPNGSVTINVSHRVDEAQVPSTAIRDIRVRPDGRINTVLRTK